MKTITLTDLQLETQARKAQLGILDTPAEIEAMRNIGTRRTPAKRELLRRIAERAAAESPSAQPATPEQSRVPPSRTDYRPPVRGGR